MSAELTLEPRLVKLTTRTNTQVRRTLPHRELTMIGAWCFIDHYGPTQAVDAMSVAQHPHVGLQTVSWLFEGEIEHRDSVGSVQLINPGQLNLMTSGHGIAHSELSLEAGKELHGVQLWVALPKESKDVVPHFEHHGDLPEVNYQGLLTKVFMGEWLGVKSEAKTYSPIVGAEISGGQLEIELPLDKQFEYGFLVDDGELEVNGKAVFKNQLHYLPAGSNFLTIKSNGNFRGLVIGGEPFGEEIIMWWNFIGRTHDEIVQMRKDWQSASDRFPSFEDRIGGRIPAPELPNLQLKPRSSKRSVN
jgi:redox-sensitive bicupin YhaK (pirin superfamily)